MSIDIAGLLGRLKSVLPARWFADSSPVLDAVLAGIASAWVEVFSLLDGVDAQKRVGTANGIFLDIASVDYFGPALTRRVAEVDVAYRARIQQNLVRPRATRASVVQALQDLTGRPPVIFEPRNPADTGGYNANMGYGLAGGYGSMTMPYQFLVQAYRPNNSEFQGNISDTEIYAGIAAVVPTTTIAWTNISN